MEIKPRGEDAFGYFFEVTSARSEFNFKFRSGIDTKEFWEDDSLNRFYTWYELEGEQIRPDELWCVGHNAFVYHVLPQPAEAESAGEFLKKLHYKKNTFLPDTGGLSGLGATILQNGKVLFGLYHPNAARVYIMGTFNDWERPCGTESPGKKCIPMKRYRGYFGVPNIWLAVVDNAHAGDEYKFIVQGGVASNEAGPTLCITDPYARKFCTDFSTNNAVVVDPAQFLWTDRTWKTPDISQLIIYELSVYGFTERDNDIPREHRGSFKGISDRIQAGYFSELGITALEIMPLAESPPLHGQETPGYDPSAFCTVERDFGDPDDLRQLVDNAHQGGIAVILDMVFDHTSNTFNPLWKIILEHPDEEYRPMEGGLYFNGATQRGNRIATEKEDVQNLLIDSCKLLLTEYHIDGFRFEATYAHTDHGFLLRLGYELKAFKPDVILIAENLPNQRDLNFNGYDGFAQWSDPFHDKIKAILREGTFEKSNYYSTEDLASVFFFSKDTYAAHTNNTINYAYSHNEHSIAHEISFNPALNNSGAKNRKGRLGLFSCMVALGSPMIYMGQEFNKETSRNRVTVNWPGDLTSEAFYQWASRLIKLRRRYPGLKISGYNPVDEGTFHWILGPWMDSSRGGGKRVLGWRATPHDQTFDTLLIMLNFENHDVMVDIDLEYPGSWVKLADIDNVEDLPPFGSNSPEKATTMFSNDGKFGGFVLPGSSGFIYKWESAVMYY